MNKACNKESLRVTGTVAHLKTACSPLGSRPNWRWLPAAAQDNRQRPETRSPCWGIPRQGSPSAFSWLPGKRDSRCAHTQGEQTLWPGRAPPAPSQPSQVPGQSMPDGGPSWPHHSARSVLEERGRCSVVGWGQEGEKMLPGRDEKGRQASVPGLRKTTPPSFSGGHLLTVDPHSWQPSSN